MQPRDEAGVNRGSGGSVVFANRAAAEVRHEEGVARRREPLGVRPSFVRKSFINRCTRCGVVFANVALASARSSPRRGYYPTPRVRLAGLPP